MEERFITRDGYTLEYVLWRGEWTDGDITFYSDADGYPIDIWGQRLEGEFA